MLCTTQNAYHALLSILLFLLPSLTDKLQRFVGREIRQLVDGNPLLIPDPLDPIRVRLNPFPSFFNSREPVEHGGSEGAGTNLSSRDLDLGAGVGGSRGFVHVGSTENCGEFLSALPRHDGLMRRKTYA